MTRYNQKTADGAYVGGGNHRRTGSLGRVHRAGRAAGYHFRAERRPSAAAAAAEWWWWPSGASASADWWWPSGTSGASEW